MSEHTGDAGSVANVFNQVLVSSNSPSPTKFRKWMFALALIPLAVVVVGYWTSGVTAVYDLGEYVQAFEVGLAGLDADLPQVAEKNLTRAVELIPTEAAGWANRGVLFLRTGRLPEAQRDLDEAARLAPNDPDVMKLQGLLKQRQGEFRKAAELLRKALEQDESDVQTLYALARIVDQEQAEGSDAEYQRLMERIVAIRSDNLRVLSDLLRVAARRGDAKAVDATLARFDELAPAWQDRTKATLAELKKTLADPAKPSPVVPLLRFTNTLLGEKNFARQAAEVVPPDAQIGNALRTFRKLPAVETTPAPPDMQLAFAPDADAKFPEGGFAAVLPVWLTGEGRPVLFVTNPEGLRRIDSDQTVSHVLAPAIEVGAGGLLTFDWNNDLRSDLLLVGLGIRFIEQQADGSFAEHTDKTGLAVEVLSANCHAALSADVDLDGDLDVLVSRSAGPLMWLRNNLDGTFTEQPIFEGVEGPQTFAWADFDHDGVADCALLDGEGRLRVFSNERSGTFHEWPVAPPIERMLAMTLAEVTDDGVLDLIGLREDGALLAISDRDKRTAWETRELARTSKLTGNQGAHNTLLLAADLDNNGASDLLISGPEHSELWLGTTGGKFQVLPVDLPPRLVAAADLRGTGRLDLLGLDTENWLMQYRNTGKADYHWVQLRPQGTKAEGDNRINSFGIGGAMELRAGTLVVKQPIRGPVVHFGLGDRKRADVVRIEWPNGSSQIEFDLAPDATVVALQRLKGSCPFLYAWNGERFAFVTDFMWSTPLGMYINAADKGGFLQTTDWVKIAGDQLVPKDGHYELRVNANLWETHYFDHVALMAVDHPADTEMFVDERFQLVPTEPSLQLVAASRPIAQAWDHLGRDATAEVRSQDGHHLDRAGRGRYQGITNDHWVEVDLGPDPFPAGPVWLVARGWIHPTDSSVNYAIEQGEHVKPTPLVLEIPDGQGGWKVAKDRLGFLAGKNKTALIRLDDIAEGGVPRRFRIRTNLEIYWDALHVAEGRDTSAAKRQVLEPEVADLRFRGIVAMTQADASSPELPHYDEIVSTGQPWRDLIGYHTRFGAIGELVKSVDDRYAILTAGDDVVLRYPVPAPPPPGWKRDFVWISDGWVKDGDYNTRFGKTVLPLPAHDMTSYDTPRETLEDDPVYRRFPADWSEFHTRYVTPDLFERGLRGPRRPTPPAAGGTP